MMTTQRKRQALWPDIAVLFPLMTLMSVCVVYPYVKALDLGMGIPAVLLMNAAMLSVMTPAFRGRKSTLLFFGLLAAGAAALAALYITGNADGVSTPLRSRMDSFLYWAAMYLSGYRRENPDYKLTMAAIYGFIVCLAVALFTVRRLNALVVSLFGAACFASLVIIGHTVHLPSLFGCILAAMLYFLLQNYRAQAREVHGVRARGLQAYMTAALPFAAVVLGLTVLLSFTLTIDPEWMKDTRDRLIKKNNPVSEAVSNASGSLVVSATELGGDVLLNDNVLMEVDSPVGNVYLRGTSKDVYTGHSWEQSDTNPISFYPSVNQFKDMNELSLALEIYGNTESLAPSIQNINPVKLKYKGLSTGIVYYPLYADLADGLSPTLPMWMVGGDTLMLRDMNAPGDFEYSLSVFRFDTETREMQDLLKGCARGYCNRRTKELEEALAARLQEIGANQSEEISDEEYLRLLARLNASVELADAAAAVYSQYTRLPIGLPGRVGQLAREITDGLPTDYDKAKAIERYLSDHYDYTLTPGTYDKTKDFVDEFLFNGKRGYCTYYATAMTVLLRCAGIPSRYVEGYVMPPGRSGGVYKVTKKEGHAWVEAYLEGFGWLPFEPTTSFSMAPPQSGVSTAAPSPTPTATPAETASAAPTVHATDKPAAAPAMKIDLGLPLLLLASAAALFALLCIPLRARSRMLRMKPRDAAVTLFAQYLSLLALHGVEWKNGEPFADFAARVDALPGIPPGEFSKAAAVFQLARYSTHEVTYEQKDLMLGFRKALLAASRRAPALARYLFRRYLWGA